MIEAFFFGFLNGLVLFNSTILSFVFAEKNTDWKKLILSIGLWYFVLIFTSEISLGVFSLLENQWIWIWHLTCTIIVLLLFWVSKKNIVIPKIHFSTKSVFWGILLFAPWLIIFLLRLWQSVFQIPLEYDSLSYHLPFIAEWIQSKTIWQAYYSAFSGPIGFYPSNFELFGLWVMLPFHSDMLIHFINFPVFGLLLVAFLAVSKHLKISTPLALASAALFFYMPQTFRQIGTPLVDIFFCYAFLSSLFFLLEYQKTKATNDFFMLGLSIGVFLGTKYLGVPYAVPLLIFGFLIMVFQKKNIITHHGKNIFLGMFGILLGGGFWYIRNYAITKNPLFPTELPWAEGYAGMAKKLESTSLINNIFTWEEAIAALEKIYSMIGFSAYFIIVAGIGLLGMLIIAKLKNKIIPLIFLLSFVFYGGLYVYAPYSFQDIIPNVRYAMVFLIIGSLAFGYIFSQIWWIECIALAAVLYGMLISFWEFVVFSSPEIIGNDKMTLSIEHFLNHEQYFYIFSASLLLLMFSVFFIALGKTYIKKFIFSGICFFTGMYGFLYTVYVMQPFKESLAWAESSKWYSEGALNQKSLSILEAAYWLNKNKKIGDVAYSGFNLHYHFFGRHLERKVDYVNINECTKCRYEHYSKSSKSIRRDPNAQHWIDNIKKMQKKYLVISPNFNKNIINHELDWALQTPETFTLVYKKNDVFIFSIHDYTNKE